MGTFDNSPIHQNLSVKFSIIYRELTNQKLVFMNSIKIFAVICTYFIVSSCLYIHSYVCSEKHIVKVNLC